MGASGKAAGPVPPAPESVNPVSPWIEAWRMFRANRPAVGGLFVLVTIVLVGLLGPLGLQADPFRMVAAPYSEPGTQTFLGTDYLGRDVFVGVIYGTRATLALGLGAAALTVTIGVVFGALAGFYGGWVDNLLMRVTEFFQVLPALLFAMVLVTVLAPSALTVVVAIGVVAWPTMARLTRAEFMKIKGREFVAASRAAGATNAHIIWRIIMPNALPPLIIAAMLTVSIAILFEASLSFLGLNDPEVMTWGLMIGLSRDHFFDSWWSVTFPGLAIFLTVLSLTLVGDGLNDALNPKLRRQ